MIDLLILVKLSIYLSKGFIYLLFFYFLNIAKFLNSILCFEKNLYLINKYQQSSESVGHGSPVLVLK